MFKKKIITPLEENFTNWYTDICLKADLMSYSQTKGFIFYKPWGFALWEEIQKNTNLFLKKTDHQNVYMPLIIPKKLLEKEASHIKGFAPESIKVIFKENQTEELIIRPTSEALFSDYYAKNIQSYRDLPKKYNQWVNVVREEKNTRPFLRGKEFLWQEGHTIHETAKEAKLETKKILNFYIKLGKDKLAIPFISGKKTEKEKFAGAKESYTIEALTKNGYALQSGTSHYLDNYFSKAFNIQFSDRQNKLQFPFQTSWGISTRLIGTLISVHSDNYGLVMPPFISPIQIVIIPLKPKNEQIKNKIKELKKLFQKTKIRFFIDYEEKNIGWKFTKYEIRGIPLRIEIGFKEIEQNFYTIFNRFKQEKEIFQGETKSFIIWLKEKLKNIHTEMYEKASKHLKKNTHYVYNYSTFKEKIKLGGFVVMSISGPEAEEIIKKDTQATARAISLKDKLLTKICPVTGKKALQTIFFAKAY